MLAISIISIIIKKKNKAYVKSSLNNSKQDIFVAESVTTKPGL